MLLTTVSSRGQIILPSKLREINNIKQGMKFIIESEGNKIILTPVDRNYFEKISGCLSSGKGKLLKALAKEKEKEKQQ